VGTFRRAALSPDGAWLAYVEPGQDGRDRLGFVNLASGERHSVEMLKDGDAWVDFAWSPDSRSLAALMARRSEYSGKVLGNTNLLVSVPSMGVTRLPDLDGLNVRLLFDPSGKSIYRAATLTDSTGSHIAVDQVDLLTKRIANLTLRLQDENYIWVEHWTATQ
jgi:Tol biopolymer transport system component